MMRPGPISALFLVAGALAFAAPPPKPLLIQNVALSQYEDGPSVPASSYFLPGESIAFSFQVSGYRPTGEDQPGIRLNWSLESTDPAGLPIIEPQTGKIVAALAQEDKNWMPKVRQTIQVPPFAPSGTYHVSILVKDEIATAETRKEIEFRVRGREVETSPTLVLRNCHFYRGEDDKEPLPLAAYRPGDTVWIRFDIAGFKLGEHNQFDVGYGIAVARPNGETMFQQPEAAVERDQSFYPRRYMPAALSLNLTKDLNPGQYTVILKAEDKVGGQKIESRQTFNVER